jgi:hypothetical protein
MDSPSTNGSKRQRGPGGRFAKGNPGGPGNPYAGKVAKLREAGWAAVKPAEVKAIYRKLLDLALAGDTAAARLLLDRLQGPADTFFERAEREELKAKLIARREAERQEQEAALEEQGAEVFELSDKEVRLILRMRQAERDRPGILGRLLERDRAEAAESNGQERQRGQQREEYHTPEQAALRKVHPEWFADETPPAPPEPQSGPTEAPERPDGPDVDPGGEGQ